MPDMTNVVYHEEQRFVIDKPTNYTETGIVIRVRLVRCEIDGTPRLHRRTLAYRYSGERLDPYTEESIIDSEKLFPKNTPESKAIRETIELFDNVCIDIASESNTYINGFTEKPEDDEIPY